MEQRNDYKCIQSFFFMEKCAFALDFTAHIMVYFS